MTTPLTGTVALITGSSSGIGAATARRLVVEADVTGEQHPARCPMVPQGRKWFLRRIPRGRGLAGFPEPRRLRKALRALG
jgi:hypothetical protein